MVRCGKMEARGTGRSTISSSYVCGYSEDIVVN